MTSTSSIGIIGGADGPTAIFLASGVSSFVLLLLGVLAVGAVGALIALYLRRR